MYFCELFTVLNILLHFIPLTADNLKYEPTPRFIAQAYMAGNREIVLYENQT